MAPFNFRRTITVIGPAIKPRNNNFAVIDFGDFDLETYFKDILTQFQTIVKPRSIS